eukprot:scaffold25486_cov161-Isochrysis_galbana.AAC.4
MERQHADSVGLWAHEPYYATVLERNLSMIDDTKDDRESAWRKAHGARRPSARTCKAHFPSAQGTHKTWMGACSSSKRERNLKCF